MSTIIIESCQRYKFISNPHHKSFTIPTLHHLIPLQQRIIKSGREKKSNLSLPIFFSPFYSWYNGKCKEAPIWKGHNLSIFQFYIIFFLYYYIFCVCMCVFCCVFVCKVCSLFPRDSKEKRRMELNLTWDFGKCCTCDGQTNVSLLLSLILCII